MRTILFRLTMLAVVLFGAVLGAPARDEHVTISATQPLTAEIAKQVGLGDDIASKYAYVQLAAFEAFTFPGDTLGAHLSVSHSLNLWASLSAAHALTRGAAPSKLACAQRDVTSPTSTPITNATSVSMTCKWILQSASSS